MEISRLSIIYDRAFQGVGFISSATHYTKYDFWIGDFFFSGLERELIRAGWR
jgi:hypothetical protein